jgi:hypothetical protein
MSIDKRIKRSKRRKGSRGYRGGAGVRLEKVEEYSHRTRNVTGLLVPRPSVFAAKHV